MSNLSVSKEAQAVMDNIKERRSIRQFKPDPVPEEALQWIIEAARWAPSAHNFQPTEYIVVKDREALNFIAETAHKAARRVYGGMSFDEIKNALLTVGEHQLTDEQLQLRASGKIKPYLLTAPVIIIVVVDKGSPYYEADGWMAVQNLLLAAHALGLGTIPTVRSVVNPKDRQAIREYFGVPENYELLGVVPVGYPNEQPVIFKRDVDELIHREKFGRRDA